MDFTTWTIEELIPWAQDSEDARAELIRKLEAAGRPEEASQWKITEKEEEETAPADDLFHQQMADFLETFYNGIGLPELFSGAKQGNLFAKAALAMRYMDSTSEKEQAEGVDMIRQTARELAAKRGIGEDILLSRTVGLLWRKAGNCYDTGLESLDDETRAREILACYEEAREYDKVNIDELLQCYEMGIGTQPKETAQILEIAEESARAGGYPEKMRAGYMDLYAQQPLQAQLWFSQAAETEDLDDTGRWIAQAWMEAADHDPAEEQNARMRELALEKEPWAALFVTAYSYDEVMQDEAWTDLLSSFDTQDSWEARECMRKAGELLNAGRKKRLFELEEELASHNLTHQVIFQEAQKMWRQARTKEDRQAAFNHYVNNIVPVPASGFTDGNYWYPYWINDQIARSFGMDFLTMLHKAILQSGLFHDVYDRCVEYIHLMEKPVRIVEQDQIRVSWNGKGRLFGMDDSCLDSMIKRYRPVAVRFTDTGRNDPLDETQAQALNAELDSCTVAELTQDEDGDYPFFGSTDWVRTLAGKYDRSAKFIVEAKKARIRAGFQGRQTRYKIGDHVIYTPRNKAYETVGLITDIYLGNVGDGATYGIRSLKGDLFNPRLIDEDIRSSVNDVDEEGRARLMFELEQQAHEKMLRRFDEIVFYPIHGATPQLVYGKNWIWAFDFDCGIAESVEMCRQYKETHHAIDDECRAYIRSMPSALDLTWGACVYDDGIPYPVWAQEGASRFSMDVYDFYCMTRMQRGVEYMARSPQQLRGETPVTAQEQPALNTYLDKLSLPMLLMRGEYQYGDTALTCYYANPFGKSAEYMIRMKKARIASGHPGTQDQGIRTGDLVEFIDPYGHVRRGTVECAALLLDGKWEPFFGYAVIDEDGCFAYRQVDGTRIRRLEKSALWQQVEKAAGKTLR